MRLPLLAGWSVPAAGGAGADLICGVVLALASLPRAGRGARGDHWPVLWATVLTTPVLARAASPEAVRVGCRAGVGGVWLEAM
jgi:hypothetical protein